MGAPKSRGLFRDHYVVAYLSITGHCRIQITTSTAIGEHNTTLRVKLPTWDPRTNTHVEASKKVGLQGVCDTKSWISPRHTGISIPVYFILLFLRPTDSTLLQITRNPTTLLGQMISQVKGCFWTPRCSMHSMHCTLHSETINFLSQSNGHGPHWALWFQNRVQTYIAISIPKRYLVIFVYISYRSLICHNSYGLFHYTWALGNVRRWCSSSS